METKAVFPAARQRAGMYESFYLRAVDPVEPVGIWIRHTVHKRPGARPKGSVWCTVFDAREGRPFMHKLTSEQLTAPADGWIAVGGRSAMGPGRADGECGPARWSLRFTSGERPLAHLGSPLLYRAPLPRTKLTSPAPAARFEGVLELDGRGAIEVHGWRGMVGHNWGSEHAERWIWLHGVGFEESPDAWLDVALGRVRVGGRTSPWFAYGALALDGRRQRIGGLGARGLRVAESVEGCALRLAGEGGLTLAARLEVPAQTAAGWRYADPDGGEHDVVNCSIASLRLELKPREGTRRVLHTGHGGAYELGMRERDHGVPLAPFADG